MPQKNKIDNIPIGIGDIVSLEDVDLFFKVDEINNDGYCEIIEMVKGNKKPVKLTKHKSKLELFKKKEQTTNKINGQSLKNFDF